MDAPVIIVGGGGCGLNLSIFLSDLGVEHYLFEKHSGTSILPKAHYLNQRVMEIFRQHGIAEAIKDVGCPIRNMSRIDWRTSLGGDEIWDRRIIASVPAFGGQVNTPAFDAYRLHSPELSSNLPLIRSEPIFRKIAEERNPGKVLFSHCVTEYEDNGELVLVGVQGPDGEVKQYRTQYLIGADGGRFVGPKIGIEMEGPRNLVDFVSTHFRADLSEHLDDRTLITHFINPEGESMAHFDSGALVQMGPTWGRRSEEWTLHFGFPITDNKRFDKEALPSRIRQLLKLPELEMDVLHVSHWVLERTLANKYGNGGRVFVAGDAAHKRPPTTGLGLNTSIQDAHNIAWKLAFVIQEKAHPSLLNTYETERRPIGEETADWGLFTFSNFQVLQAAVGLIPGEKDYNQLRFARLFEDSKFGEMTRHQIRRVIATQDIEFSAHGIEMDMRYDTKAATVPDGTPVPKRDPSGTTYTPSSRPGHRLPHAWLEKGDEVVSTHDLVGAGREGHDFLLITDEAGSEWTSAAQKVSKAKHLKIRVVSIKAHRHSRNQGCFVDRDDEWNKVRGIQDGGALLVRPDNFIAWRSQHPSVSGGVELIEAISVLLGDRGGHEYGGCAGVSSCVLSKRDGKLKLEQDTRD